MARKNCIKYAWYRCNLPLILLISYGLSLDMQTYGYAEPTTVAAGHTWFLNYWNMVYPDVWLWPSSKDMDKMPLSHIRMVRFDPWRWLLTPASSSDIFYEAGRMVQVIGVGLRNPGSIQPQCRHCRHLGSDQENRSLSIFLFLLLCL